MNFTKFETTPTAVLTEVTDKQAAQNTSTETPNNTGGNASAVKGSATIEDIFQANNNTKVSPLSVADNPTTQPTTANAANNQIQGGGSSVALGQMLEGKLAIELMDAMLPGLFVAIFYAIDIKLRKSELQLTQKEKDTIAPIMQACLNTIMLNFNSPWTTLAVTVGVIYGSKVTEKGIVTWIDKLTEKKEQEALEEKTGLKVVSINKEPVPVLKNNPMQNESANTIQNNQSLFTENAKPYGEKEIQAMMKRRSIGRERAMKVLDKKYQVV